MQTSSRNKELSLTWVLEEEEGMVWADWVIRLRLVAPKPEFNPL